MRCLSAISMLVRLGWGSVTTGLKRGRHRRKRIAIRFRVPGEGGQQIPANNIPTQRTPPGFLAPARSTCWRRRGSSAIHRSTRCGLTSKVFPVYPGAPFLPRGECGETLDLAPGIFYTMETSLPPRGLKLLPYPAPGLDETWLARLLQGSSS
jgi:hypothetical protein